MQLRAAIPVLLAAAMAALPMEAGTVRFSGALTGTVTDGGGRPQAEAIVLLFSRQNKLLQRSVTDSVGSFAFAELMPDLYSVQVSLTSFLPAMRDQIQIRAGMRSMLSVNLSKVFSTVQLVSVTPLPGGLMSDNWKWTLRADTALRPILRFLPEERVALAERSPVFTDSRGMVRISASDGGDVTSTGDLGTQFAFETSVYGGNRLQVAGDLGYASASGNPSASIRTTYSRSLAGGTPAVSVTMRQFYMPMRMGQAAIGNLSPGSQPVLRTMDVSLSDKTDISDSLRFEYGFELDSVSFGNHLEYFSPWGRLTQSLDRGTIDFTWTSGNARPELGIAPGDETVDMQRNLAALSALPRVTLRDGEAKVQRGSDFELGISQRFGSRVYRVSAYYDDVANTTLMIASPVGNLFPGELMPDMMSNSSLFNAGTFQSAGYRVSATQDLGDSYHVTASFGSVGVMTPREGVAIGSTATDLRNAIVAANRPAFSVQASGTVRRTRTRFVSGYEWVAYQKALPAPLFATESGRAEPGLNVAIRQPIPTFGGLPGRIEASAELRNLLAQGYVPVIAGGQQLLLVNMPRSVRGGLSFIF